MGNLWPEAIIAPTISDPMSPFPRDPGVNAVIVPKVINLLSIGSLNLPVPQLEGDRSDWDCRSPLAEAGSRFAGGCSVSSVMFVIIELIAL